MSDDTTTTTTEGSSPDFSTFVPDTYKGQDGAYDVAKFRADFDSFAAAKSQADERAATLAKTPDELVFSLPEGHAWPEGFDPAKMITKNEKGEDVAFDPTKLIDEKDPDIPALQAALHKAGVPKDVMGQVASIFINREVRNIMNMTAEAEKQKSALGPQADARIATVTRTLNGLLPKEMSSAILDSITTADVLRGLETLLKDSTSTVPPAGGGKDLMSMSRVDRIAAGLNARKSA